INLSTIRCAEFLTTSKEGIGYAAASLDAFHHTDEDDPLIVDSDKLRADAKRLADFCAANPELRLMSASEKLLSSSTCGRVRRRCRYCLKAKIRHGVSALILDHPGALDALERGLGIFVAERCGLLVICLGGVRVLLSAATALSECAHPLQRTGVTL